MASFAFFVCYKRNSRIRWSSVKQKAAIFVSKMVPSGIHLPILKGPLKGLKWIVGAAGGDGKGLSTILNLSEQRQLDFAKRLVKRNRICFDIGANVGLYTLLFARLSKQVFAFEPLPRNIRYLSGHLEINGIKNAIILPIAVSNSTKLLRFKEGLNCAMGKLDDVGEVPVMAISCDDFVRAYHVVPSLIKIDVEGAELEVLMGAKKLLLNHKPSILLSVHSDSLREKCLDYLAELGYDSIKPINQEYSVCATEFAVTHGSLV